MARHKPIEVTKPVEEASEVNHKDTDRDIQIYKENKLEEFRSLVPKIPYSLPLAKLIIEKIYEGKRLTSICSTPGFPQLMDIFLWLDQYPEFKSLYDTALKVKGLYSFDAIEKLAEEARYADKSEVPGMKLAFEAYKLIAERSDRERYAPPTSSNSGGAGGVTININTGVDSKDRDTRTLNEVMEDLRKANVIDTEIEPTTEQSEEYSYRTIDDSYGDEDE